MHNPTGRGRGKRTPYSYEIELRILVTLDGERLAGREVPEWVKTSVKQAIRAGDTSGRYEEIRDFGPNESKEKIKYEWRVV